MKQNKLQAGLVKHFVVPVLSCDLQCAVGVQYDTVQAGCLHVGKSRVSWQPAAAAH